MSPRTTPIPPMPDAFGDRAAWDAIHWPFAGNGCLLDQAVMQWQRANQERVKAAIRARAKMYRVQSGRTNE